MIKILLIIPPFTQINTPYPSTSQLTGFLKSKGYNTRNFDLSLAVTLRIFSKEGLQEIFSIIEKGKFKSSSIKRFLALSDNYINVIDSVIKFLQGKDPNLAYKIINDDFLPAGDSFNKEIPSAAFGYVDIQDKAKYYCSMFVDDLTYLIQQTITPYFGLSRYAERIAISTKAFTSISKELNKPSNIIDQFIIEETRKIIKEYAPKLVGYTIPFPGNLFGTLISSRIIKEDYPNIKIVFGGGYVNTELRNIIDADIFNYTDYITLDDGEIPILNLIKNIEKKNKRSKYVRTFVNDDGVIKYLNTAESKEIEHDSLCAPNLYGINPSDYISMTEALNPMYRLWSDGYWNKIMLAHGCYWHKCKFCDTSLDYIHRFSPAKAKTIVDWMENMIAQSGRSCFHFTDEAAPPRLLKEIAVELLKRKLKVTWWGNIRFEKYFSKDVCKLLALSGCIAVSGGFETANNRLLDLMNKGVSIEQCAVTCYNLRQAGIMVHAYLMYGFPSQTEIEIIDSLEVVRQFIQNGLIQSAFWHLFALTIHSEIAQQPEVYGIKINSLKKNPFANNDLSYNNLSDVNYALYSEGLKKALYNYLNNNGLDKKVNTWFTFKTRQSTIECNYIRDVLTKSIKQNKIDPDAKVLWTGSEPIIKKNDNRCEVEVFGNNINAVWKMKREYLGWLKRIAETSSINSEKSMNYGELAGDFPNGKNEFDKFIKTKMWQEIRNNFLLFVEPTIKRHSQ